MCDDVQNCCRICLDAESDHVSILGDPTISLHMKSCLSVTVSANDHLPKTVCLSCVSLLNQFYNFQLNARCSQDWLESSVQEKLKKPSESKMVIQPLPDSEYNSDSLLEFLNNTANIEEYLNNLGKEDIPCIVNMLDRNEHSMEISKMNNKVTKVPSPKKKDITKKFKLEKEVLDTDYQIAKGFAIKETDVKIKVNQVKVEKNDFICFGCKIKFDTVQKLLQHLSVCDIASRTCIHCNQLFNSKLQMQQHSLLHNTTQPFTCNCGEEFPSKERLMQHHKTCHMDYAATVGYVYRCKGCGDTFRERFQLYKHAKEHIIKSEERVCDICGHTFPGSDALNKHRKEEHEKPENVMYKCKICNITSTDRKEMYLHVKKHTARPEPTRHLCESCGRSFTTRTSLLRHSLLHSSDKTVCHICQKQLMDTKLLEHHLMEHIEIAICEKCGQSMSRFKLATHGCV
ncbi:zinc finger protein 585A-like [Helicoverpa armigera]|uniref:zinc finger protein 585A-like n=1 Tax=Helicoverpa zea TaxID=7113 RepID=UPI001F58F193|nr:zinc finger protein 585A-like [Helicoverpa zea]